MARPGMFCPARLWALAPGEDTASHSSSAAHATPLLQPDGPCCASTPTGDMLRCVLSPRISVYHHLLSHLAVLLVLLHAKRNVRVTWCGKA